MPVNRVKNNLSMKIYPALNLILKFVNVLIVNLETKAILKIVVN